MIARLVVTAVLLVPNLAAAQVFTIRNAAEFQKTNCRIFVETDPPSKSLKDSNATGLTSSATLATCLSDTTSKAQSIIKQLKDAAPGEPKEITVDGSTEPIGKLNAVLTKQHVSYKHMKRWVGAYRKGMGPGFFETSLPKALDDADSTLHEAMSMRGLNEVFSAALMTGAVVTNGASLEEGEEGDQNATAAAHVVWESKHFGAENDHGIDFSFGGRFGFIPALTLVTPSSQTPGEAETDDEDSVYQEAFVWDVGAKANFHILGGNAAEVSTGFRIGQTILGTESVLIDRGAESILAVPVDNGTTHAEWFYEVGVQYNLFNQPLDVVHGEGTSVSPLFTVGVAWRHDNRFKKDGALVAFDAPERRLVFRFMIDALKIIDRRELGESPRVFTLGFGVEHEAGFGSGEHVPPGTKLIFKGDINLLRALRGRN